ncbi:MAG: methyltransferase domain-containing protein [Patescibacteria group bacterium]
MRNFLYKVNKLVKEIFTYHKLTMSEVDYDAYWRDKRGKNIGVMSDWQIERADFVVSILNGKKNISISDIACGEGSILNYIGKSLGVSKLIGTDISNVALDRAKGFGIEVRRLDIEDTKELEKIPKADYQILFEILEHVPHSEELLRSAVSKAIAGVFFSFPNTGFFVHRLRLLFGRFPLQWRLFPGEHIRFWTKRDLVWWLYSLGYSDFKIHFYKGVPILNKIWPSLFAAGFVVYLAKAGTS